MNALHVKWLSRRRQLSLIPASSAAYRMVSPTCIILALPFFILMLIGSVYRTSCVEIWHIMSPGDGGSPHSLVGDPIMGLHEASLIFTNTFFLSSTSGLVGIFFLFHIS